MRPYTDELILNNITIPILIYLEPRNGTRASFTSKGINVRIPNHLPRPEIDAQIAWAKKWAQKKIKKTPSIAYRYIERTYGEGHELNLYDRKLKIAFVLHNKRRELMSLEDDKIVIYSYDPSTLTSEGIKSNFIKLLNKVYQKKIEDRVRYINSKSVNKSIDKITLKYLKSQWGNCGRKGQIKLSTRILLLPEKIQNAIILHELVHLVHFNHSSAFYNTLESYMPDYKTRDRWLKKHEGMVDF